MQELQARLQHQGISTVGRQPPVPPPRKYVSLFRIDGAPILPPLMTSEKRRQMNRFRDKAIKIEAKLEDQRRCHRQNNKNVNKLPILNEIGDVFDTSPSDTPRSQRSGDSGSGCGSMSQHSFEYEAERQRQERDLNESFLMLSSLMQRRSPPDQEEESQARPHHPPCKVYRDSSTSMSTLKEALLSSSNSGSSGNDTSLAERLQKLGKSETIIYDNRANTIIMPMRAEYNDDDQEKVGESRLPGGASCGEASATSIGDLNLSGSPLHRTMLQPLPLQQIPAIFVDPPTPLIGSSSFTEVGGSASSDCDFYDDDEDVEETSSNGGHVLTDTTTRILFIDGVGETPPEQQQQQPQKRCSAAAIEVHHKDRRAPQRSATSPQLNLEMHSTPNKSLRLTAVTGRDSETALIRSNSFTLAGPSKALLAHLHRQKVEARAAAATTAAPTTPTHRPPSSPQRQKARRALPSASTTRDTVESKAKRVQKAELGKPTRSPVQRVAKKQIAGNLHSSCHVSSPYASHGSSTSVRNKRSPYDSKSGTKTKARPTKKTTMPCAAATPKQVRAKSAKTSPSKPATVVAKRINETTFIRPNSEEHLLSEYEAEHRQKFLRLLAHQQDEQKRMQAAFEAQQQQLLQQLANDMNKVHLESARSPAGVTAASLEASSPGCRSEGSSSEQHKSPTQSIASSNVSSTASAVANYAVAMTPKQDELGSFDASTCSTLTSATNLTLISNSRCTPRRRLFTPENQTPPTSAPAGTAAAAAFNAGGDGLTMAGSVAAAKSSPLNRCLYQQHQTPQRTPSSAQRFRYVAERRIAAATTINAYARGFLVRRMFQTEQIQRIVQTIRDTLIFVLNLHMETLADPEEANTAANVKLKARLLQQLSSATRTLHLVFFQTTVRERMEIIARDRKRITTKLLAMTLKRSPRIATC